VDLLGVQVAHELQDFPAEHLAGHQHREAWRVGRHIGCRDDIDSGVELFVDLLTHQVFAVAVVV
jgi:hypothetical protein